MCGVTREEEDRLLSGAIREDVGGGRVSSEVLQGHGASVLQLRHFIQVRSQHFGSFYVVVPDEEE